MAEAPFLSICIPTFNRAKKLRRCLESVLPLTGNGEVEICVSDNASSDSTRELLENYAQNHNALRYASRANNDGIDVNMLAVAQMAKGKYIYWLGDDDEVIRDEFTRVVEHLKESDCDCLLTPPLSTGKRVVYDNVIDYFVDYEIFGLNANMHFSTIFIKRAAVDSRQIERFLGTFHLYSGAVFDYLCMCERRGSCKITVWDKSVCKIAEKGEKTWSSDKDKIYYETIPQWYQLLPEEIRHHKRCRKMYKKYFRDIICSDWACKNFKFRIVWRFLGYSMAGLIKRGILSVRKYFPAPRKFLMRGKKYKLYKIGPFRFSRESKRGRMHGSLDGAIQEKGQ